MSSGEQTKGSKGLLLCLAVVAGVLLVLFARSLNPALVLFANDGPLGANMARAFDPPSSFFGVWVDLNWLGFNSGAHLVTPTYGLLWLLGPVYFAKFYGPITLLLMGLAAWAYFRQANFRPFVCILGALAMALNMNIFSNVCWGLGTRALCVAGVFGALAFIQSSLAGRAWLKLPLAGLCLGISIMEGADNGAIFSLYVAAFTVVLWLSGNGASAAVRGLKGVVSVAIVALFAAFMATQALISLLGVVKGLQTTQQQTQQEQTSSTEAWDRATTWSLPKKESLRVLIPGLHGYRMDTPEGGAYWGTVGMTPGWETHRQGVPRYSGAGEYAGVLVILVAVFALVESFRRDGRGLTPLERRIVWFWAAAALISVLLAWGRHAPFYRAIYALPYFSTIRNPIKYMHPFHVAVVIMFAYGLQALSRRYLETAATNVKGVGDTVKAWWAKAAGTERKWTYGVAAILAFSVLSWLFYANAGQSVLTFLRDTGFSETDAREIRGFSVREVAMFVLFLALSGGAVLLVMSGALAGPRTRWAGVLLGLILVVDLARANLPWIKYYDYQEKYASNPVIELLREHAWEHRIAMPMFQVSREFGMLQQIYQVEWLQHHFQFYNIQSLDVTQEPQGEPPDKAAFRKALMPNFARLWQLTNTRFLFGMAGPFVDALNQQLDPGQRRFRMHTPFTVTQTPNKLSFGAETNDAGPFALIEFTGALPRAKLYSSWQVNANDQEVLQQLARAEFDPEKSVIISGPGATAPDAAVTNNAAGTVEFAHYEPKVIRLRTKAAAPSVLLLNDRFDPEWKVTVDGASKPLLRANFTMRGVQVPAGEHTVEFRFERPVRAMYVSIAAIALGIVLSGLLFVMRRGTAAPIRTPVAPQPATRGK